MARKLVFAVADDTIYSKYRKISETKSRRRRCPMAGWSDQLISKKLIFR